MKTAFIAYRHTGEDPAVLEPMLTGVRQSLAAMGIEAYCTFFVEEELQNKSMNARQIMEHAFETIESRDLLFVVQAGNLKSEGMLMEVGRFFGRKPIIVATNQSEGTYLPSMADYTYSWQTPEELIAGVRPAVERLSK